MSEAPHRIQLKRSKGWRMPENTVKVTRPGYWGNPFTVTTNYKPGTKVGGSYVAVPTVEDAVECYRIFITEVHPEMVAKARNELGGKNIACFCNLSDKCHAGVLLEIANG